MAANGDSNIGGDEVTVNIRRQDGSTLLVRTGLDSTTVGELKLNIVAQSTSDIITADQQLLIYKGQILKDDQTLESYGLEGEHTVHMLRRLPAASTNNLPPHSNIRDDRDSFQRILEYVRRLGFGPRRTSPPSSLSPTEMNELCEMFENRLAALQRFRTRVLNQQAGIDRLREFQEVQLRVDPPNPELVQWQSVQQDLRQGVEDQINLLVHLRDLVFWYYYNEFPPGWSEELAVDGRPHTGNISDSTATTLLEELPVEGRPRRRRNISDSTPTTLSEELAVEGRPHRRHNTSDSTRPSSNRLICATICLVLVWVFLIFLVGMYIWNT